MCHCQAGGSALSFSLKKKMKETIYVISLFFFALAIGYHRRVGMKIVDFPFLLFFLFSFLSAHTYGFVWGFGKVDLAVSRFSLFWLVRKPASKHAWSFFSFAFFGRSRRRTNITLPRIRLPIQIIRGGWRGVLDHTWAAF